MPYTYTPAALPPPALIQHMGMAGLGATPFAEAIARMEGWPLADSAARRNNNPGNLTWAPSRFCQREKAGRFVSFCTQGDGWAALDNQIAVNARRDLTLYEFFAGKPGVYPGYAPAADNNDPDNYARKVAEWLGVGVNDKTATVLAGGGAPPPLLPGDDGALLPGSSAPGSSWWSPITDTVASWIEAGDSAGQAGEPTLLYAGLAAGAIGVYFLLGESG